MTSLILLNGPPGIGQSTGAVEETYPAVVSALGEARPADGATPAVA